MSMEGRPDLLVLAPDTPEIVLALEVKLQRLDEKTEARVLAAMESYLDGMRCPVGVLVSWPWTYVLTGPTTPPFEAGYQRRKVSTSALLGLERQPITGKEAEAAAFAWLSRLTTATPLVLPNDVQALEVVSKYLVPAAAGGRVYAS